MSLLIQNGNVVEGTKIIVQDLYIEAGKIVAKGSQLLKQGIQPSRIIDATNQLVTPGFIDLHVHLREPGFSEKETIATGSLSAAKGGYSLICAMPNVNPTPDNAEKLQQLYQKIAHDGKIRIKQYAPITEKLKSEKLVDQSALKSAGAFAFTNDGVGVQSAGVMYQAMLEAKKNQMAIVAHTEDDSLLFGGVIHAGEKAKELGLPGILSATESAQIARDIELANVTGVHYHICHISTKESVELVRQGKRRGIHVTCEVTPHHLLLCDEDIPNNNGMYKMNPPLRGKADQEALIAGILDGTIDCIATDHAPHTEAEKNNL